MEHEASIDSLMTRLCQEYQNEGNQLSLDQYYAIWYLKDKVAQLGMLVDDYQNMIDHYRHEIRSKEEAVDSLQARVDLYRQELDFLDQLQEERTRESSFGYRDHEQGR